VQVRERGRREEGGQTHEKKRSIPGEEHSLQRVEGEGELGLGRSWAGWALALFQAIF